jgi:AcrR family transcriptional regulator
MSADANVMAHEPAGAAREPKQARSRETRARLLDAAITCLARDGWTNATVTVIADEAGISRGALQHHFPTREDLITAALDYVFERRAAGLAEVTVPTGRGSREEFVVRLLVGLYSDNLFKAALQVWTAAAADESLRAQIVPLERKFARGVHGLAVRLLGADDEDPTTHALIQATLDMARGLGLADVLTDDSRRRNRIAQEWAAILSEKVQTLTRSDGGQR